MIIAGLAVLGLCLGSFVNALVWRLHEQSQTKNKKYLRQLSITKGRSICPDCKHELAAKDLLPVLSWLSLKGKCRYCGQPISWQYPLVELATAGLFVFSYLFWSSDFDTAQTIWFIGWLALLTGLMALLVYDLRWQLLPDKLTKACGAIAVILAIITVSDASGHWTSLLNEFLAVLIGGGLFYLLFQVSKGKWIGGGDVKLGFVLGLIAGTPGKAFLLLFGAALLGTLVSLPLLAANRVKRNSVIPFGPFLIVAVIVVQLFGADILHWYRDTFLLTSV